VQQAEDKETDEEQDSARDAAPEHWLQESLMGILGDLAQSPFGQRR